MTRQMAMTRKPIGILYYPYKPSWTKWKKTLFYFLSCL